LGGGGDEGEGGAMGGVGRSVNRTISPPGGPKKGMVAFPCFRDTFTSSSPVPA
jgi:hypothetical protein